MNRVTDTFPAAPDTRGAIIEAIEAHIARKGMTRTGFGAAALKDRSFMGRLDRGSDMCLGTADKVLEFLGFEPIGPRFRSEVKAFLSVTRTKPHHFGEGAVRDPTFETRLRGGRSPRLATVDRVRAWMAETADAADMAAVRAAVENDAPAVSAGLESEEEMEMDGNYMTTKEAAEFLCLSPRTLDRYRGNDKGPPYYLFGTSVRYRLDKLKAWAAARRKR